MILKNDISTNGIRKRRLILTIEMFLCAIKKHGPKFSIPFFIKFRIPWEENVIKGCSEMKEIFLYFYKKIIFCFPRGSFIFPLKS